MYRIDVRASHYKINPLITCTACTGYKTPTLEMCMGMGFPMGPGIPWEWE